MVLDAKKWLSGVVVAGMLLSGSAVLAQNALAQETSASVHGDELPAAVMQFVELTPHALIENITIQLQTLLIQQDDESKDKPEVFYQAVGDLLSPVVAFDYIAKGVMGPYAKQATAEQLQRFSQAFQSDLINTYAKGMAVYGRQEITVLPLDGELGNRRKVRVIQRVRGDGSDNTVAYTMGKSRVTGEWKLLNVVINGINLGNTFRSQFAQAMKKKGDLEQVISGWSAQG